MNGWNHDMKHKNRRNPQATPTPVAAKGTRPYAAEIIKARTFSQYSLERFGRIL